MKSGYIYEVVGKEETIYFVVIGFVETDCEIAVIPNPWDDIYIKMVMDNLMITNTISYDRMPYIVERAKFIRSVDF